MNSSKLKTALDIVYMTTSITGALLVAANIGAQLVGYTLFLISSLTAIFLLTRSNASKSLIIVNLVFALINLVGIIRS